MKKGLMIVGSIVQIILFFTPMVESKIGTYSGWQIATDDSGFISNAGLIWFFLLIPIALLICAFANAKSPVLGMVSLSGLIASCIWVFGYGDGWEFLAPTYIMLVLYIGLTIFAFTYKGEDASSDTRRSYSTNRRCRQCGTIFSSSNSSCPKCNCSFFEETNQSTDTTSPPIVPINANYGDTWTCKKCGDKNPLTAPTCKGCGEYK
jgi:hypothetical protein